MKNQNFSEPKAIQNPIKRFVTKKNLFLFFGISLLSITTFTAFSLSQQSTELTTKADSNAIIIPVVEDATVRQSRPNKNFGLDQELQIDEDKASYLKFNLAQLSGQPIAKATLRVYVTNASSTMQNIKEVTANWNETTINAKNQPTQGPRILGQITNTQRYTWKDIDITSYVTENRGNLASIVIDANPQSTNNLYLGSKESSKAPTIVVEMLSSTNPTLTVPTTAASTFPTIISQPTVAPTTPVSTPTTPPVSNGSIWKPAVNTPWQWQISGAAFNPATDMIAGVHVYDIDLFNNSAQVVAQIKQKDPQAKVICYMETGSWEDFRPDANQYPTALLGKTLGGYPDEKFVDIRNINNPDVNSNQAKLRTILKNRLQQCKDKGFDGIEPDLDDSYQEPTGFPITMADNVTFNKFVADEAHKIGLSIGLKNGSEEAFVKQMAPLVDWAVNEQCFQYDECDAIKTYLVDAGKPVFNAEYTGERRQTVAQVVAQVCPKANAMNFNTIIKKSSSNLDPTRTACR